MITYKGYAGRIDSDADAEVFGGTVANANVLMAFEGKTVAALRRSFRDVVETYLADCKAAGKQPEKPYNGTIIIRVDPEIHRRVVMKAAASRKSMNKYVLSLLEKATEDFAAKPQNTGGRAQRLKCPSPKWIRPSPFNRDDPSCQRHGRG